MAFKYVPLDFTEAQTSERNGLGRLVDEARSSPNALSSFSSSQMMVTVTKEGQKVLISWEESGYAGRSLDMSVQFGAQQGGEVFWSRQDYLHWNDAFQYLPAMLAQPGIAR